MLYSNRVIVLVLASSSIISLASTTSTSVLTGFSQITFTFSQRMLGSISIILKGIVLLELSCFSGKSVYMLTSDLRDSLIIQHARR